MHDIASLFSSVAGPLLVLTLVTIPIAWVGTLGTGQRGKNARKVLAILFRHPPQ
ncbi:hypothetical protein HCX50_04125 [Microbacterium oxydans]|uniref:hypothetical protein n=1 Tax=Microbacterium sp. B19(2022) TaxID=2914045 RepID=UPI00142F7300|nr:hypothetical protein [Microbacterium sp. B19(2022)]NJI58613.1 hypothetical protein [Microbacterium sp. B19(2022)]